MVQGDLFETAPIQTATTAPQYTLTEHRGDFGRGEAIWQTGDENGEGGTLLHFAAANGFPVGAYRFFLRHFSERYRVYGLENRGMWGGPAPQKFSWQQHADDLIAFLETLDGPVVGVGHSIGATVTALAARKRPDLFKTLVLIDPAAMPGRRRAIFSHLIPHWVLARLQLVQRTRGRRVEWPGPEALMKSLRGKSTYRGFSDIALQDYAEAALAVQPGGTYTLRYNRDWEALNFQSTVAPWRALRDMRVPTLVLRGEHSYLHPLRFFEWHTRRFSPRVSHGTIEGAGHMAIQEDCEQVLRLVHDWLDR